MLDQAFAGPVGPLSRVRAIVIVLGFRFESWLRLVLGWHQGPLIKPLFSQSAHKGNPNGIRLPFRVQEISPLALGKDKKSLSPSLLLYLWPAQHQHPSNWGVSNTKTFSTGAVLVGKTNRFGAGTEKDWKQDLLCLKGKIPSKGQTYLNQERYYLWPTLRVAREVTQIQFWIIRYSSALRKILGPISPGKGEPNTICFLVVNFSSSGITLR